MNQPNAALIAANPFPGLRSFKPTEADRFFGRQQQIDALVARLAEVSLVAVSGASGCGKSSLVLAGLLNELKRRHEADTETDWRPVVMRPGNRPIANLAAALAQALGAGGADTPSDPPATGADADADGAGDDQGPVARRIASLYGQLRLGGLALVEVVRLARLPVGTRVLVVVDQFEEIFRFKRMADADEASAFVKLLLQAAADPAAPVSVVLTLRSDTLGGCADFPDLPEAVSRGSYLVPRLSRNQRKEAITRPVALRGARIAPRLVQRLLSDVSDDFDDLPVMQHALSRTWQRWAETCGGNRAIDLEDYDTIGGAAGALSQHAEEARLSLGPLGQAAAAVAAGAAGTATAARTGSNTSSGAPRGGLVERVFRALTERVAEGTEVRRPLDFNQLCAVCGGGSTQGTADVTQVVDRYRRADTAFLVPGIEVPLSSNPVIDISHESLIRQWQALRGWVRDEAEAEAELQRLVDDSRKQAEADGELWRGRNLERARDWQQRNQPNAAWVRLCSGVSVAEGEARFQAVQGFLDKSTAAEQADRRRSRLRRRGGIAAVVLVTVASLAAAVNALSLQRKARSGELAARSIVSLAQDPARSARLALLALEQNTDNPRAAYALRQAMAALEVVQAEQIIDLGQPVLEARYTPGFAHLVVAAGKTVWLRNAGDLSEVRKLTAPGTVEKAWLVGDKPGDPLVVGTDDGRAYLLAADGKVQADLSCQGKDQRWLNLAYYAATSKQSAQFAVGCSHGEITRWDLPVGAAPVRHALMPAGAQPHGIVTLAFAPDGRYLATADLRGDALIWRHDLDSRPWIGDAKAGKGVLHHKAAIRDIGFSPTEPSLLATASDDGTSVVWTLDLERGQLVPGNSARLVLQHDRPVVIARFVDREDEKNRLMTVSDKRVNFWSDEKVHDERRHDDEVIEASVSKDGEQMVSASLDGTARVWSSRSTQPVAVLRGHSNTVTHALFGPPGRIVTASRDGTLRGWRLNAPTVLTVGNPWLTAQALLPDGRSAIVCRETTNHAKSCDTLGWTAAGAKRSPVDGAARPSFGSQARSDDVKNGIRSDALVTRWAVDDLSLSADGGQLLLHDHSNDIYQDVKPVLFDLALNRETTPAWLAKSRYAVFSPGRPEVAVVDRQGEVTVWPLSALVSAQEAPAGSPLLRVAARPGRAAVALSPDGRWLATMEGRLVMLWDRSSPQAKPITLAGHQGDLRRVVFSPDSSSLVSASAGRSARVWTLKGLEAGQMLDCVDRAAQRSANCVVLSGGHSAALQSANFSPDGRRVVTASADNSIRVWDATTGHEWAALYRHGGKVNSALFDRSGEQILSVSDDGMALIGRCDACRLPLAELQQRARDTLRLTTGEEAALKADAVSWLPRWLGGG